MAALREAGSGMEEGATAETAGIFEIWASDWGIEGLKGTQETEGVFTLGVIRYRFVYMSMGAASGETQEKVVKDGRSLYFLCGQRPARIPSGSS